MNKIFFVIGASGAGKTTTLKNLEKEGVNDFLFCYFDSVGVPSDDDMIRDYGSGEEWQRITTQQWVKKILDDYIQTKSTILDGQTRPSFIDEACKMYDVKDYKVILFDCSDEARKQRLIERGHAELVNEQMMNWAKYLRVESAKHGYEVIDNTDMTIEESKTNLLAILNG